MSSPGDVQSHWEKAKQGLTARTSHKVLISILHALFWIGYELDAILTELKNNNETKES